MLDPVYRNGLWECSERAQAEFQQRCREPTTHGDQCVTGKVRLAAGIFANVNAARRQLIDLAHCTQILAVIPKGGPQAYATDRGIDLETARLGLASGQFRGVQVRYRYEKQEWCDTLLAMPGGVRLVRISLDEAQCTGTVD